MTLGSHNDQAQSFRDPEKKLPFFRSIKKPM